MPTPADTAALRALIHDVPDFPKPGIVFKDITPLLEHPAAFRQAIAALARQLAAHAPDGIVAVESRGFLFGAPLAMTLGLPLIVVRKPGKLPRRTEAETYLLEYGEDRLEIHADAVHPGRRYAIVDDVLATGGTAAAVAALIRRLGGVVVAQGFLIELAFFGGRGRLRDQVVESLISYS